MADLSQDPAPAPDSPEAGGARPAARYNAWIEDALRCEKDWRREGQTIQKIYRGELDAAGKYVQGKPRYNILFSNTAILLPSIYQRPPKPEIRSRGIQNNPVIDQAMEALQRTTEVVLEGDDGPHRAFKAAVKELLLPGRGTVRIRWDPIVEETEVPPEEEGGDPMVQIEKVLDQIKIEHVYWEDFTFESVKSWDEVGWVAFRHLFTKREFKEYFSDSPVVQALSEQGKLDDIFKWTDRSAGRREGDAPTSDQTTLQDTIKKAMVWEVWDKSTRQIVWLCRDVDGGALEVEDDVLGLSGFFPCAEPLMSVTTTDTLVPVPEYVIYQDLAAEVDETSERIANITKRIKVRGAYNGSAEKMKDIVEADDGTMLAVEGLDLDFDISKHVYIIPNEDLIRALQQLYASREQSKQAMYDVTGISDIVRGQSRASETLGAQQIKSQFASLRIKDRKDQVERFSRSVVQMICEIVAEHFSPESIYYLTNIMLPPEVFQMLRSDALRVANIDVETDSTVAPDETADKEAMGDLMTSLSMVMQQIFPLVNAGFMPPQAAMAIAKFATKPFRYSRDLHKQLDQIFEQAQQMQAQQPPQQSPEQGQPAPQPGRPALRGV